MQSHCPRCQAAVEPGDAFCPNCGTALLNANQGTALLPAAQTRQDPNQPYQPLPPHSMPRANSDRRPWYKKKRFTIPLTLFIILAMMGIGGAYVINLQFDEFQAISTPEPDSTAGQALQQPTAVVTPSPDNSITLLMMGVDAQEGEQIDFGVRPDSLSVLHINPDEQTCRVVTIPRDTRTELTGYGQSKINHALSVGGVEYQILATQNLLGIKIDHFALVDFAGVVGVVDAVGGVHVNNQRAFELEGHDFPVGDLHLNGEQALAYSRFRGDSEGDFGRQRRQQEVVRGLLEKANGLDAARAIPGLLTGIEGHFKTDLSITSLISMAGKYRDYCTADRVESVGLEGTVGNDWDDMMEQELSFVHISRSEIDAKVRWLRGE